LILRKGKEEIERTNTLMAENNNSISSSASNASLYRRLAQTDEDTELTPNPVTESEIRAAVAETQMNAEELQEKAKVKITLHSKNLIFRLFR
jgi:hypothetical protein